MHRAFEKRLLTPRDAGLYPLKIESIEVESAGLVASGDLLLVMRVADGRRMAMRAPMAGRMLRITASVGDVIHERACAMTMREEPDLELPADHRKPAQGAGLADAPWGDETRFGGYDDGLMGTDWPKSHPTAPPSNGGAALGRIQPVKRAVPANEARYSGMSDEPPRAKRKRRYPWTAKNSGEHEAEAPHSKQLWAGLAGLVLLLFILGAIPEEFYREIEQDFETGTQTIGN